MTDRLTAAQEAQVLRLMSDAMKRHRETCITDMGASRQSLVGFLRDEAARREAQERRDFYTDDDDRTACRAAKDGECHWASCPQERDGEPKKSGRHCPLDNPEAARREAEATDPITPELIHQTLVDLGWRKPDAPPPKAPDLVLGLRDRARHARAERNNHIATSDAWHFEQAADAIEALRAERDQALNTLEHARQSRFEAARLQGDAERRAETAEAQVAALRGALEKMLDAFLDTEGSHGAREQEATEAARNALAGGKHDGE